MGTGELVLNWLARYAPVVALLRADQTPHSILDVGCGPHGLACAMDGEFAGIDILYSQPVAAAMHAVRSRPGPFPFADGAFDTIICLDALEHIPGPERAGFVAELARVAARRVIVACPSSECQPLDDHMARLLGAGGGPLPEWLTEHYECGLPTPEEIADACHGVEGFSAVELAMGNGLLSAMTVLAEFTPLFGSQAAAESAALRDEWVSLYASATFGPSWRKGWVLTRVEALSPIVSVDDYDGGLRRALRCPDCGGAHDDAGAALVCSGCGRAVTHDDSGAWNLADAHIPRFFSSPEWTPASLRALLNTFLDATSGPATLTLHAPPSVIHGQGALACAQAALGDRVVPEDVDITIVDKVLDEAQLRELRAGAVVLG